MFVLRRVSGNGVEMNHAIGSSYTLVHSEQNPEEFEATMNAGRYAPETFAFVSDERGKVIALYGGQTNYIMTDSGQTFARIQHQRSSRGLCVVSTIEISQAGSGFEAVVSSNAGTWRSDIQPRVVECVLEDPTNQDRVRNLVLSVLAKNRVSHNQVSQVQLTGAIVKSSLFEDAVVREYEYIK